MLVDMLGTAPLLLIFSAVIRHSVILFCMLTVFFGLAVLGIIRVSFLGKAYFAFGYKGWGYFL